MIFRRGLSILFLFILAACQPAPVHLTATPSPQVTPTPQTTVTPQPVKPTAVADVVLPRGVTIQIWYPWFGVEANLFQSQVDEFNQTNAWGILVQTTSQSDYNELFQNVGSSLPTADCVSRGA